MAKQQNETLPIGNKPTRISVTVLIREDIWKLIGAESNRTGYSRGKVIEQMVAELQKQTMEAA